MKPSAHLAPERVLDLVQALPGKGHNLVAHILGAAEHSGRGRQSLRVLWDAAKALLGAAKIAIPEEHDLCAEPRGFVSR